MDPTLPVDGIVDGISNRESQSVPLLRNILKSNLMD